MCLVSGDCILKSFCFHFRREGWLQLLGSLSAKHAIIDCSWENKASYTLTVENWDWRAHQYAKIRETVAKNVSDAQSKGMKWTPNTAHGTASHQPIVWNVVWTVRVENPGLRVGPLLLMQPIQLPICPPVPLSIPVPHPALTGSSLFTTQLNSAALLSSPTPTALPIATPPAAPSQPGLAQCLIYTDALRRLLNPCQLCCILLKLVVSVLGWCMDSYLYLLCAKWSVVWEYL